MRKNFVRLVTRLAGLACLSSALSFAGNWSGILVDSQCWDSQENNTRATSIYVDRDSNLEIGLCSPGAKTKSFAIVQQDGLSFKLDAPGNAKAAGLIKERGKKASAAVVITGETSNDTINVQSISMARQEPPPSE
jgi:hypothetical protein